MWVRDAYRYLSFGRSQFRAAFRGVYETFEQAEAAAPAGKKIGYNHEELARAYQAELNFRLSTSEYPVLFYLQRILGHLEKFLSPSPHESDSVTARGHGRMERAGHGAEGLFRC
jgi:hypothetical protein